MKIISFVLFFLSAVSVQAKLIDIGLFPKEKPSSFHFIPKQGEYTLFTEKGKIEELGKGAQILISKKSGKLNVSRDGIDLGSFEKLNFIGTGVQNYFEISILQ